MFLHMTKCSLLVSVMDVEGSGGSASLTGGSSKSDEADDSAYIDGMSQNFLQ